MKQYIFLFYFFGAIINAQTIVNGFALNQKIGSIAIHSTNETENLKEFSLISQNAQIKDGKFVFSINGLDEIPRRVFLIITKEGKDKLTERFYIDRYTNTIVLEDNPKERYIKVSISPLNKNQIDFIKMQNYFVGLNTQSDKINDFVKSRITTNKEVSLTDKKELENLQFAYNKQEDSLTDNFIRDNPDSYIAFWRFTTFMNYTGNRINNFELFNNFNKRIKNSILGVVFKEKMNNIISNKLPNFQLNNQNQEPATFNNIKLKRFNLVDFWFSYCAPCLSQMAKYKEIYTSYKDKGFEIIAISTDRTKDIPNWQKTIKERKLNWQQFLDIDGKEAIKYDIVKFPTNYLLDGDGKILKKDISQEELAKFLDENLKK